EPEAIEARWVEVAKQEHASRRGVAIGSLVLSALFVGAATFVIADRSLDASAREREEFATVFYAVGAIDAIASIYALRTDGPVESRLRVYEQTTGRVLWPKEAKTPHLNVGFVPGGAMGSFTATF